MVGDKLWQFVALVKVVEFRSWVLIDSGLFLLVEKVFRGELLRQEVFRGSGFFREAASTGIFLAKHISKLILFCFDFRGNFRHNQFFFLALLLLEFSNVSLKLVGVGEFLFLNVSIFLPLKVFIEFIHIILLGFLQKMLNFTVANVGVGVGLVIFLLISEAGFRLVYTIDG